MMFLDAFWSIWLKMRLRVKYRGGYAGYLDEV